MQAQEHSSWKEMREHKERLQAENLGKERKRGKVLRDQSRVSSDANGPLEGNRCVRRILL